MGKKFFTFILVIWFITLPKSFSQTIVTINGITNQKISNPNEITSVLKYNAKADGISRTDGSMVAGSIVLNSASGTFSSADVGKYIQVIGAGPGGSTHSDGVMNSGSPILSSEAGTFTANDVGRGIMVIGAGSGGSNLFGYIQAFNSPTNITLSANANTNVSGGAYFYGYMTLEGTILSVQSATQVTLSTAASGTITNTRYAYGTDNEAAFKNALDTIGASGGGLLRIPKPDSCPAGADCGYVFKETDMATAPIPAAIKIQYPNIALIGDPNGTNIFCRGAYSILSNSAQFGAGNNEIRGSCILIGDPTGPLGTANINNTTIQNLHLFGMTNGRTFTDDFTPSDSRHVNTGDGWDETHKGIYLHDNATMNNVLIDHVWIQDFKGENIYGGGDNLSMAVISNSTFDNFNGDGISIQAADLQVVGNTIKRGFHGAVENSTTGDGGAAPLIRQVYRDNNISDMCGEGITVVGVDNNSYSGELRVDHNHFDTIGVQPITTGARSAVKVGYQGTSTPIANVTVLQNTCHDCDWFLNLQDNAGPNVVVKGNDWSMDKYSLQSFFLMPKFAKKVIVQGNYGTASTAAISAGKTIHAIYNIQPGYFDSAATNWSQFRIRNNTWDYQFPLYYFGAWGSGSYSTLAGKNVSWNNEICSLCITSDTTTGQWDLSAEGTVITPMGPVVMVFDNSTPITATIDASKSEDGTEIQIKNIGSNTITFVSDTNISLVANVALAPNSSVFFRYVSGLNKWILIARSS